MKIQRIDRPPTSCLSPTTTPAAVLLGLQDDLVVEVQTDEGLVGIGETDTNPWVARECIRARGTHCMGLGLQEMLLERPTRSNPKALWGDTVSRLEDDGSARRLDLRPGGD